MTDEEFAAFAEAMDRQAAALHDALAADLDGGAGDAGNRTATDGGE